jgi:hypothetical protein
MHECVAIQVNQLLELAFVFSPFLALGAWTAF